MAERNGIGEQVWSGPAQPAAGPEVDRSFGAAEAEEPLPIAEGHDEDAAVDEVRYPLADPERSELAHHLLTTGVAAHPLEDRMDEGAYPRHLDRGDAAFTDFLSPADPLAMSAAPAYAGAFAGQAQLAEVEALIGALPSAWALAAPTRGLFPMMPTPQRGGGTVMETVTPLDPHLGNPMATAAMDATKDLFHAGALPGDEALYASVSAGTDDGKSGGAATAASGKTSASDEAQGEPILRIERLIGGGDDGDSADKLGAIASGGPTGTIASHRVVDDDVAKPRLAATTEPAPEASIAVITSDRRVDVSAPDRDGSSGPAKTVAVLDATESSAAADAKPVASESRVEAVAPDRDGGFGAAKPTDVPDATDGLAGVPAKPTIVEPAPTKPVVVDPASDDARDEARPDAAAAATDDDDDDDDDDERNDETAEAGPSDAGAEAIGDADTAEAALPTPAEKSVGELGAVDENPPPFPAATPPVESGSLPASDAALRAAAGQEAGAWPPSVIDDWRSDAVAEARNQAPGATRTETVDAADVDYPPAGPGVPSAVAEAVLAMLNPGPRGGPDANDPAGNARPIEDQLWLLPEAEQRPPAGNDDHVDRYPLPVDHVDWNEPTPDAAHDGDAL